MKKKVYFVPTKETSPVKRAEALKKLLGSVGGILNYGKDEIIPVKITIGDEDCVFNVSPELVKIVISLVKSKGAKPFLFDTSVIYHGKRQNAVDHLALAQSKGFGYDKVGASFVIADGVLGQDGREFEVSGENVKKIKTPSFVSMLESLIVISHPTGHLLSGYGGAIKNVAMGMSCRPTKQVQHSSVKPSVDKSKCTSCGCCLAICPVKAISWKNKKADIDKNICVGCGECLCACKFEAININWEIDPEIFGKKMAEVASFVLAKFKNKFFFNFAFEITKECDCISTKDEKMSAANIGILASEDPVAIDQATMDLARDSSSGYLKDKRKVYELIHEHAEKLGAGSREYELVKV